MIPTLRIQLYDFLAAFRRVFHFEFQFTYIVDNFGLLLLNLGSFGAAG